MMTTSILKKISHLQMILTRAFFVLLNRLFVLNGLLYVLDKCRYYFSHIKAAAYFPKNKNLMLHYDVEIKYSENIKIGKHVRIGPRCTLGGLGGICIGDDVVISKDVLIETAGLNYHEFPYRHVGKPIVIGNRVWIGAGAIILGGVSIGDDSIIGAGTLVTKHVPSEVVVINENKLKFFAKN